MVEDDDVVVSNSGTKSVVSVESNVVAVVDDALGRVVATGRVVEGAGRVVAVVVGGAVVGGAVVGGNVVAGAAVVELCAAAGDAAASRRPAVKATTRRTRRSRAAIG